MTAERMTEKVRFTLNGGEYVLVTRKAYDRLVGLAKAAELPARDSEGNFPAVAYARSSIARTIVTDRVRAGLTQKELARLAGVRVETLCRIEKGRNAPTPATVARIESALQAAVRKPRSSRRRTAG